MPDDKIQVFELFKIKQRLFKLHLNSQNPILAALCFVSARLPEVMMFTYLTAVYTQD